MDSIESEKLCQVCGRVVNGCEVSANSMLPGQRARLRAQHRSNAWPRPHNCFSHPLPTRRWPAPQHRSCTPRGDKVIANSA
eukprot:357663-Chlamydomonas_euryale.AAC.10